MIAPTDTWADPAPEGPAARPPEPDDQLGPAPGRESAEPEGGAPARPTFLDALMRALGAIHT